MAKKNIFIVGLDDFNLEKLRRLPEAETCAFHAALHRDEIRGVERIDPPQLIDRAIKTMESFEGSVDGVAAFFDFPATTILPILADHFHLPGPSLESVLKCEHKYWSRLEQAKVIPAHIPKFQLVDPFDDEAAGQIKFLPPFWIKPVKSFHSYLAYRINDFSFLKQILPVIREKIGFIGQPFRELMEQYGVPREMARAGAQCLAETATEGSQCTLEGYVYNGQVEVYGIVDSIREMDRSSFSRYEYPSSLPKNIQQRMVVVARIVIQQLGLNNTPFNMEFFFDQTADRVYVLEVNPRISQAHGDIFERVHGISHHRVMLHLALGEKPLPLEKQGMYDLAAHFMVRVFDPGTVMGVPGREDIERIKAKIPGCHAEIAVRPGQHLMDLQGQDSYSYEIAHVFVGGADQQDILDKYQACLNELDFDIHFDKKELSVSSDVYKRICKFRSSEHLESMDETLKRLLSNKGY